MTRRRSHLVDIVTLDEPIDDPAPDYAAIRAACGIVGHPPAGEHWLTAPAWSKQLGVAEKTFRRLATPPNWLLAEFQAENGRITKHYRWVGAPQARRK